MIEIVDDVDCREVCVRLSPSIDKKQMCVDVFIGESYTRALVDTEHLKEALKRLTL